MQLSDLIEKPVSEMSDEELEKHILQLRQSRRIKKEVETKTPKKIVNSKAIINKMSVSDIEELLKELQ